VAVATGALEAGRLQALKMVISSTATRRVRRWDDFISGSPSEFRRAKLLASYL
jgi:hypothetical protein